MRTSFQFSKALCCVVAMLRATSLAPAETVWLSSLDLTKMTSGWSVPKADLGVVGKPISINGKPFTRGVGTHAKSRIRLDLGRKGKRFFAQVGLDDSTESHGSVEFLVTGDGRVLWRSGLIVGRQAARTLDVDITGVSILGLRVTDGNDGTGYD